MKSIRTTLIVLGLICSHVSFAAKESDANINQKEIKIFTATPSKSYTILSPISVSKRHVDDAFKKIKEKATELGADAIINLSCKGGEKISKMGSLLASDELEVVRSRSICEGIAIKWD